MNWTELYKLAAQIYGPASAVLILLLAFLAWTFWRAYQGALKQLFESYRADHDQMVKAIGGYATSEAVGASALSEMQKAQSEGNKAVSALTTTFQTLTPLITGLIGGRG